MKVASRSSAWAVAVWCACAPMAPGQAVYTDVTSVCGLTAQYNADGQTSGLTAIDYDDDGDIDLFVPQRSGSPNLLFQNVAGVFSEIGASVGLASTESSRVALWFDYDADHDLDLLLYNDSSTAPTRYRLYRQDPAGFVEVTAQAGLMVSYAAQHTGGLCAGDINNDGYLDFFSAGWVDVRRLFLNNTDGTFTDITVASGIGYAAPYHWQPVMHDFDRDGWMDLYLPVDAGPNQLWRNQQNGTFANVAVAAGASNNMNDMGVTLGDYDNDGDLDIYITNIYRNGPPFGYRNNILYRNDTVGSTLAFTDVSAAKGVGWGGWGWGATFMDCDNDTLLDIAATNGFGNWDGTGQNYDESRLYRNAGSGSPFQNISAAAQFNDTDWGSALVALDFDRDGPVQRHRLGQRARGARLRS